MKKNDWGCFFVGVTLLGLFFLGGCAGSRTYLLNLGYDTSKTPPFVSGVDKPVTLAVYNIQDARPDRLYLGRRVYRDGTVDFFKPDGGTIEQVVTKSFVKLLEKAGFKVTLVNRYLDPAKEDFKDIPGDAAFGGKIEALWVESKTGLATTDTDVKISFRYYWALVKDKIRDTKTIEESGQKTYQPLFKPKDAEDLLNEVFKDCLDKLLKDEPALREKLLKGK